MADEIRIIRLLEARLENGQMVPTGREIQLYSDCPLFDHHPWSAALAEGVGSIDQEAFETLKTLILDETN